MTIKQFIERAIEGGWNDNRDLDSQIEKVFLSPLAWQAVGKVEGWHQGNKLPEFAEKRLYLYEPIEEQYSWLGHMHRMLDALAEGKTITQFLETL